MSESSMSKDSGLREALLEREPESQGASGARVSGEIPRVERLSLPRRSSLERDTLSLTQRSDLAHPPVSSPSFRNERKKPVRSTFSGFLSMHSLQHDSTLPGLEQGQESGAWHVCCLKTFQPRKRKSAGDCVSPSQPQRSNIEGTGRIHLSNNFGARFT
jgi:hypothetical protein